MSPSGAMASAALLALAGLLAAASPGPAQSMPPRLARADRVIE